MRRIAGVEIGENVVRLVVRNGNAPALTFEAPYLPDRLETAVALLADAAGRVTTISLAIGLAHLHVKQVKLPPVSNAARRQMLTVEPERWFALEQGRETAIALSAAGDIALAADGAFVHRCVQALESWAPVQRIEAAPMALARLLNAEGHRSAVAPLDAGLGERGMVELVDGALHTVRRARSGDVGDAPHAPTLSSAVDARFGVALGTSLALDGTLETMLLTPALEQRFRSVQRRRVTGWAAAASIALVTAAVAAGASRDRALMALEAEIDVARTRAASADTLMSRVLTADRELAAITTTTAQRPDVPAALAALGARLPVEAVAQRVRVVGAEWQVEGNTTTAAAVLAALAAEPRFDNVRFLAPSNRFRDGTEDRETFAIAFVVR